jgi:hypothetical protein
MALTLRRSVALVLATLVLAAACSSDDGGGNDGADDAGEAAPSQPAPEGIDGVVAIRAPGDREHLDGDLDYPTSPPIGGNHNEVWANCKFYDSSVPDESAVHSLEHGAVWVTYGPGAPAQELDTLRELASSESHLIVTPYEGMSSTYVLSAWERQLELDSIGDPRFEQFLSTYLQGPTTPEPNTACSGGAG